MSFLFMGPNGSVESRWITYALLRDNVQHHLEEDKSSARLPPVSRRSPEGEDGSLSALRMPVGKVNKFQGPSVYTFVPQKGL